MVILLMSFGIAPWLLPAVLVSVLIKSLQPSSHKLEIFPTMLLSIPFTVVFVFVLFQCLVLLEKWGLIGPKGSEGLGYWGITFAVTIFCSSVVATYLAAKLLINKLDENA